MRGVNKAELIFKDQTLICHAISRLSSQVSDILLSASRDFGTGRVVVVDDMPAQGPLGGVYSVLRQVVKNHSHVRAIITVPVDAPLFPDNLVPRLVEEALRGNCPATAETADGWQPAFACWPVSILPELEKHMALGEAGSLKGFLKKMGAINVFFDDPHMFFNINSPEDYDNIL
jgi:molybdopterin-guanine dinucleotide biosynthesis protein A